MEKFKSLLVKANEMNKNNDIFTEECIKKCYKNSLKKFAVVLVKK